MYSSRRRHTDRRSLIGGAAAAAALALTLPYTAHAQYPDKPIRLIVPFPAGGGGDILARTQINKVSEALGQQFVIENRAGAGGNIGSVAGAKADPDGYTLVYGTNGTLAINHTLYKSTGFDPVKDFEPISRLSEIALLVVVHPSMKANNFAELVAFAKANPGKLNVGTAGNGTSSHLAAEMFKKAAGVDVTNVHFRGGAQAITDLVGGQIQLMIEIMANAMPQVEGKNVRALAVTTSERWPLLPDVPTASESGLPGFTVTAWDALLAPAGTPAPVIDRLNKAVAQAMSSKELQADLLKRGARAAPTSPAELRTFIQSQLTAWGDAVRASGAKIE
jgi:tripartite-type tricarboxylate transporter receptor subunit TctC